MNVAGFGLGYVGSVSAASFAADGMMSSAWTSTLRRSPLSTAVTAPSSWHAVKVVFANEISEGKIKTSPWCSWWLPYGAPIPHSLDLARKTGPRPCFRLSLRWS
jgi:hypothetical protein